MDARPRPKNYLDDISRYDIIYIVIYNDLIEVKDINREILLKTKKEKVLTKWINRAKILDEIIKKRYSKYLKEFGLYDKC